MNKTPFWIVHEILDFKELNFKKNPHFAIKDPFSQMTDPVSFDYHLTHDFHELDKTMKSVNSENFSFLHLKICSL